MNLQEAKDAYRLDSVSAVLHPIHGLRQCTQACSDLFFFVSLPLTLIFGSPISIYLPIPFEQFVRVNVTVTEHPLIALLQTMRRVMPDIPGSLGIKTTKAPSRMVAALLASWQAEKVE